MNEDTRKPTHRIEFYLKTGNTLAAMWAEAFAEPLIIGAEPTEKIEGLFEEENALVIRRLDGSIVRMFRDAIIGYAIVPVKELPESAKLEVERAKNRTPLRSVN
jgi:hypothetical protein